jgi:hypothetical protein
MLIMKPSIRHRRGHKRGAAMVEAAFMFPMFIILFFAMIYAHNYGATQIETNSQARSLAWNDAMANCNLGPASDEREDLPTNSNTAPSTNVGNFTGLSGQSSTTTVSTSANTTLKLNASANDSSTGVSQALSGGNIEGGLSGIIGIVVNFVAQIFPDPEGAQASSSGTISWRLPNNYTGDDPTNSTTRSQKVTIMCNEKALEGKITNVISAVKGLLSL